MKSDIFKLNFGMKPDEIDDILFPPTREFQWALSETPAPLVFPAKPYLLARASTNMVIDANGITWNYTVRKGKIVKWIAQYSSFIEPVKSFTWTSLSKKKRRSIIRRRDKLARREFAYLLRQKINHRLTYGYLQQLI